MTALALASMALELRPRLRTRRVGGIRFVWIGRYVISGCRRRG